MRKITPWLCLSFVTLTIVRVLWTIHGTLEEYPLWQSYGAFVIAVLLY
jgi:hypothetical protein